MVSQGTADRLHHFLTAAEGEIPMLKKIVSTVVVMCFLTAVAPARGAGTGHGSSLFPGSRGISGGHKSVRTHKVRSSRKIKGLRKKMVKKKSLRKATGRKKKDLAKSKHKTRKRHHKTRKGSDKTRKRSLVKKSNRVQKFSASLISEYATNKKYLKNRVVDKEYNTKYGKRFRFRIGGVVQVGWKYVGTAHKHWEFFFFNTYYKKWLFFDPCTATYYYYCSGCDCYWPIEFICCKCLRVPDDPEDVPCDACAAADDDNNDNEQNCCGQILDDDNDQDCCGQTQQNENEDDDDDD
jgi:hypothetical protein